MMGNMISRFNINDHGKLIIKDFAQSEVAIDNYKSELVNKNIDFYEQELSIEVIDGNFDPGSREINTDIVCAVNVSEEKIATYKGKTRWFCFDNIITLNVFIERFYDSFNFESAQVEYDLIDLEFCLASSKETLRVIKKTIQLNDLNKNVKSLFVAHQFKKANFLMLSQLCDQIEPLVNCDHNLMISSVRTFLKPDLSCLTIFYTED